jgi:isopenicillin-N epimerase
MEFQDKYNWSEVREACHQLLAYALGRIFELTGIAPLHPQSDIWFRQMAAAPLPANTDVVLLKKRLYDEYRVEVPVHELNGSKLIRISVQGYNSKKDIDRLLHALSITLKKR